MKITDTWLLAKTKLKSRRGRTITTSIIIAISLLLALSGSVAAEGLLSTAKKLFADPYQDSYFVEHTYAFDAPSEVQPQQQAETKKDYTPPKTVEEYKQKNQPSNFKNIYLEQKTLDLPITLTALEPEVAPRSYSVATLSASDASLIGKGLDKPEDFSENQGQPVPLIVSYSYLEGLVDTSGLKPLEARNKVRQKAQEIVGLETELKTDHTQNPSPESEKLAPLLGGIKFKIVEVQTFTAGIASFGSPSLVIPSWALNSNNNLKALFNEYGLPTFLIEFETEEAAKEYIKANDPFAACGAFDMACYESLDPRESGFLQPRLSPIQELELVLNGGKIFFYVVAGIIGFVAAILVLTTISKVLSDSAKEIAVFRAIGAKKNDVRKIYFLFTFTLINFGFVIGLAITYGGLMILSGIYGARIFNSLAIFSNNLAIETPKFILTGFPVKNLLIIYAVTITIGLLASIIPIWRASRRDLIKVLRSE